MPAKIHFHIPEPGQPGWCSQSAYMAESLHLLLSNGFFHGAEFELHMTTKDAYDAMSTMFDLDPWQDEFSIHRVETGEDMGVLRDALKLIEERSISAEVKLVWRTGLKFQAAEQPQDTCTPVTWTPVTCSLDALAKREEAFPLKTTAQERAKPNQPWYAKFRNNRRR